MWRAETSLGTLLKLHFVVITAQIPPALTIHFIKSETETRGSHNPRGKGQISDYIISGKCLMGQTHGETQHIHYGDTVQSGKQISTSKLDQEPTLKSTFTPGGESLCT